jgi:hypothetical protein
MKKERKGGKKRERERASVQSRGVWSRWKRAHGGLGQPGELGKGSTAGFGGKEVGEWEAGDGIVAGVCQKGTDEEEMGQRGATKRARCGGWREQREGVIAVAGAEGVVAGFGAEVVAVVGDEGVAREQLEAVAKRSASAMGEETLYKRRGSRGIERRDSSPGEVTRVTGEGVVLLPEKEGPVTRGKGWGGSEVRLDGCYDIPAESWPRDRRPRRLEETELNQRKGVKGEERGKKGDIA